MYFQTWMYWCKTRKIPWFGERIYRGGQRLCGKLIGHRASKTEWGYGGGSNADVWCRWCNQMGSIPIADLDKRYENARTTIWNFTACDMRHKEWNPEPPPQQWDRQKAVNRGIGRNIAERTSGE